MGKVKFVQNSGRKNPTVKKIPDRAESEENKEKINEQHGVIESSVTELRTKVQVVTYGDLYCQDVDAGTLVVAEYPVSSSLVYSNGKAVPYILQNRTKYLAYDDFQVPDYASCRYWFPQRIAALLGNKLKILPTDISEELQTHWKRKFEKEIHIEYGYPDEDVKIITLHPLENVAREQHSVDPDEHYKAHSKALIPTIDVQQARAFNQECPEFPCVVKTIVGKGSAKTTFMVNNQSDYDFVLGYIYDHKSDAEIIVTEMIQDLVDNHCVQFYLTKSGEIQWLGTAGQVLEETENAQLCWHGAIVRYDIQDKQEGLLKPTIVPVAQTLHELGYFGVVGVDILVNSAGEQFVVDINPRINGSTHMLLLSEWMASRGWNLGTYLLDCIYTGTEEQLISAAEGATGGEVIVFGYYQDGDNKLRAHVGVWSNSMTECDSVCKSVFDNA